VLIEKSAIGHKRALKGRPEHVRSVRAFQTSTCSAIAKAQVAKLLKLRPDFTIREADDNYRMFCFHPDYIERMNGALRGAGLPE
jgi:hypothetical protein